MAAKKKPNPAMEFIVESLKKNRKVTYAEIAEAARPKRLAVYPIMFGRAQAMLGIVKMSPRGQGKARKAAASKTRTTGAPARRGPGRPRKAASSAFDAGSLEGIIAAVKGSEQAKDRYRGALERIQAVISQALA
jgi:hypothetical protein